jgi:hypothetical protein
LEGRFDGDIDVHLSFPDILLGKNDPRNILGATDGAPLGAEVGDEIGTLDGCVLGLADGSVVGPTEGEHDGDEVGTVVGHPEEEIDGSFVVGAVLGAKELGLADGMTDD